MKKIALILLCVLLAACSGKGVDHRLNAANGFDENYHQSLNEAFADMTQMQKDLFNWAVDNYNHTDFKKQFGSSPTPRSVVDGEAKRQINLHNEKIAELQKELKNKQEEVKANDERRQKAFDIVGKFAITVNPQIETIKETKKVCEGVVCEDKVFKTYRLHNSGDNQTNLKLFPLVVATVSKGGKTKVVSWYQEAGGWIYFFSDKDNDWEGAAVTFKVDMENTTLDVKPEKTPQEEEESDQALANSSNPFAAMALGMKAMGGLFGGDKSDHIHYAVPRKLPEQQEIEKRQATIREISTYAAEMDKKKVN